MPREAEYAGAGVDDVNDDWQNPVADDVVAPPDPPEVRVRHDNRWGGAALGWLAISAGLVVYGLVVVSKDRVSNRDLLLAVAFAGAGGAALSATAEVVAHLGRRRFRSTWTAYYIVRPVLGAGMALLLYVTARGGLVSANAPTRYLNFYGILSFSFLAGMFARSALQKVLAMYDVVFTEATGMYDSVRQKEPGALPDLEPYHGYVLYETVPAPHGEGTHLTLWLQRELDANAPSGAQHEKLRVGEGNPSRTTEFRFTVYSHNFRSVKPRSVQLQVEPIASKTEQRTFWFAGGETESKAETESHPETRLTALIEISQYGQTVDVLSVGVESGEQAEETRANG
jgi:hypothetical protein